MITFKWWKNSNILHKKTRNIEQRNLQLHAQWYIDIYSENIEIQQLNNISHNL